MSDVVKKRLSFVINIVYFAVILALFYLIFKTFFGILVPFIIAFLVALLLNRPVKFITRKTPIKRGITSVVLVVVVLAVMAGLFSLIGMGLFSRLKGFYDYVLERLQNVAGLAAGVRDWLLGTISFLPEKLRLSASDSITSFFNEIIENGFQNISVGSIAIDWTSLISKGGGVLKDTVVQIPSIAVACLITVVSSVFMLTDFENIRAFILRQFNDSHRAKFVEAKKLAVATAKNMVKAYSLIILITMTELSIGLYILKLCGVYDSDYIIPIALVIAIIDIIPVLGTGTVLIPWAIYSFIAGSVGMGLGLIIIYAVIMVIRQILEPKLVAGQAGLSPIVTIMAMYIGTKAIGVLGIFILPFIAILIKQFNDAGIIHLFRSSPEAESVPDAQTAETVPVQETAGTAE